MDVPRFADSVPRTESDRYALIFDKPRVWEHAFYGSVLLDQLKRYETARLDYEIGYVAEIGPRIKLSDLGAYLAERQSYVVKLISNFNNVLRGDAQEKAFGAAEEPGDPRLIDHLARRLIDVYGDMIAWGSSVRSARAPEDAERAVELLALFVDGPIRAVREFVFRYVEDLNSALLRLRSEPNEQIVLSMTITLLIPDDISNDFHSEMDRLSRVIRNATA